MPLKIRKLTERSEGTIGTKSAIRSKMSEETRTSEVNKGTRRSNGLKKLKLGVHQLKLTNFVQMSERTVQKFFSSELNFSNNLF
jgi:hypothetical protein